MSSPITDPASPLATMQAHTFIKKGSAGDDVVLSATPSPSQPLTLPLFRGSTGLSEILEQQKQQQQRQPGNVRRWAGAEALLLNAMRSARASAAAVQQQLLHPPRRPQQQQQQQARPRGKSKPTSGRHDGKPSEPCGAAAPHSLFFLLQVHTAAAPLRLHDQKRQGQPRRPPMTWPAMVLPWSRMRVQTEDALGNDKTRTSGESVFQWSQPEPEAKQGLLALAPWDTADGALHGPRGHSRFRLPSLFLHFSSFLHRISERVPFKAAVCRLFAEGRSNAERARQKLCNVLGRSLPLQQLNILLTMSLRDVLSSIADLLEQPSVALTPQLLLSLVESDDPPSSSSPLLSSAAGSLSPFPSSEAHPPHPSNAKVVDEEDENTPNEGSGSAVADAEQVRIEQLYMSTGSHYTPNVYTFGYSFKKWTEYWTVLSTGEVYLGLPHGDPRTFDFAEERIRNPHRFVRLEHIESASEAAASPAAAAAVAGQERDSSSTSSTSAAGTGLYYNNHFVPFTPGQPTITVDADTVFRKVEAVDGLRLNGTFVHAAPKDIVESSESPGMHYATQLSFWDDGRFAIDGCLSICFRPRGDWAAKPTTVSSTTLVTSASPDDEDGSPSAISALHAENQHHSLSGRYRIVGNVIELTYQVDDGALVEDDAFFFKVPGAEDESLCINGVMYKRERSD